MKKATLYRYWGTYFAVALGCQLTFGKCQIAFFAFPVNAALLLLGVTSLWILHKEKSQSAGYLVLSAPATTFLLLGITFVSCLLMGFGTLLTPDSWWTVFTLIALLAHLLIVIYRGMCRKRAHKLRFALTHIGLLLALGGGMAGSADTHEWRILVTKDQPTRQAFDRHGKSILLKDSMQLQTFDIAYHPDGTPQSYNAQVIIGDKSATLKVNHPYTLSWTDNLYLTDYEHVPANEQPHYCVLQLVKEPWKYALWTGIWMLIAGCVLLFTQGIPALPKKGGDETC